jgi:hypothetical protein
LQSWEDKSLPEKERNQNLKVKKDIFMRIIPLGLLIGTGFGGYVMRFSRKYTFIILTFIGMIAGGISVINNMYVLFIARLLSGIIGGLIINLSPKML